MERRTFVSGFLIAGAGAGAGLAGHLLTKRACGSLGDSLDPKDFATAMKGVKLQYVSSDLLLKLFSRKVSDHDCQQVVAEVVNHNRNLFVVEAYSRQYGMPGFYRVTE